MRNIKKIFIVVFSLILLFAVSCSNDDKTGINNNPPEDTEITDGKTGGSGTGGSEEGGGGTETPPTPSETETTETIEIEAKDFPPELLGKYRDDTLYSMYGEGGDTKVSTITEKGIQKTKIEGNWLKDGTDSGQKQNFSIEKWKQTKKGGNPIKLEGELVSEWFGGKFTVTYDYETETLSGTFTKNNGEKYLFSGKKQPTE